MLFKHPRTSLSLTIEGIDQISGVTIKNPFLNTPWTSTTFIPSPSAKSQYRLLTLMTYWKQPLCLNCGAKVNTPVLAPTNLESWPFGTVRGFICVCGAACIRFGYGSPTKAQYVTDQFPWGYQSDIIPTPTSGPLDFHIGTRKNSIILCMTPRLTNIFKYYRQFKYMPIKSGVVAEADKHNWVVIPNRNVLNINSNDIDLIAQKSRFHGVSIAPEEHDQIGRIVHYLNYKDNPSLPPTSPLPFEEDLKLIQRLYPSLWEEFNLVSNREQLKAFFGDAIMKVMKL
jgi:hypothetical protein